MPSDMVELVYTNLQKEITKLKSDVSSLHRVTEQAQYVDGIPAATYANLPSDGLANGTSYVTVWFCSNGRKSGEGAGLGTGVPVYWDNASSTWLKFSDDAAVTI